MRRWRSTAAAVAVAIVLSSCTGIGSIDRGELEAEAESRGGGITAGQIEDALAAVGEASGRDPLEVLSIRATLGQVEVVVPSSDGTAAESWRYGTSGLLGGKGLAGPERTGPASGAAFTAEEAGLDALDRSLDSARVDAGRPDGWVESVTVDQVSSEALPLTTVQLADAAGQEQVVLGPDGRLVGEGPR